MEAICSVLFRQHEYWCILKIGWMEHTVDEKRQRGATFASIVTLSHVQAVTLPEKEGAPYVQLFIS